jgi:hypothetical protein
MMYEIFSNGSFIAPTSDGAGVEDWQPQQSGADYNFGAAGEDEDENFEGLHLLSRSDLDELQQVRPSIVSVLCLFCWM